MPIEQVLDTISRGARAAPEGRREELNRVVNIEYVFGPVLSSAPGLNQKFLNDEARWIGNQNGRRPRQWDALFLTNRHGPRFEKQDVEIAQLLRRHSRDSFGDVTRAVAAPVAAEEGGELHIEARCLVTECIVRHRRPVVAEELLPEAAGREPLPDSGVSFQRPGIEGDVHVARSQRRVRQPGRFGSFPEEAMSPSPDEEDTIQPWFERVDQPCELSEVVVSAGYGLTGSSA